METSVVMNEDNIMNMNMNMNMNPEEKQKETQTAKDQDKDQVLALTLTLTTPEDNSNDNSNEVELEVASESNDVNGSEAEADGDGNEVIEETTSSSNSNSNSMDRDRDIATATTTEKSTEEKKDEPVADSNAEITASTSSMSNEEHHEDEHADEPVEEDHNDMSMSIKEGNISVSDQDNSDNKSDADAEVEIEIEVKVEEIVETMQQQSLDNSDSSQTAEIEVQDQESTPVRVHVSGTNNLLDAEVEAEEDEEEDGDEDEESDVEEADIGSEAAAEAGVVQDRTDTEVEAEAEADTDTEQSIAQDAQECPSPPTVSSSPPTSDEDATTSTTTTNTTTKNDSLLLSELQENLQHQMTVRAEVENKLRTQASKIDAYQQKMEEYGDLEDQFEMLKTVLKRVEVEKSQLEQEVHKLRDGRDDLERKEAVLSNRLNNAKMKEASKTNVAGKLEVENEGLQSQLQDCQQEKEKVTAQKEKLEHSMEKLKKKCVERVKMAEAALIEERNLNEERKKKMKVFVETKAEELRSARSGNDELRTELKEISGALGSVRGKLEHVKTQYDRSSTKNRELVREMNRMKKNSEQLHQMGGNLEMELQKSTQETEEHKNKRLTAKHELMTILRKLEAEQTVSGKLRDSVKFTFTPKALSQQELLNESLQEFESELQKLSRRLGKTLQPSTHHAYQDFGVNSGSFDTNNEEGGAASNSNSSSGSSLKKKVNSRSEWDTSRLLSSLEDETQQVSKGIMAFGNAVERLHALLDTSGEKTCANTLNEIFGVLAAANANGTVLNNKDHTSNLPVSAIGNMSMDDDDDHDEEDAGSFVASPMKKGRGAERYGLVGQEI